MNKEKQQKPRKLTDLVGYRVFEGKGSIKVIGDKSIYNIDDRSVCVDQDRVCTLPKSGRNQTWVVAPSRPQTRIENDDEFEM